MTCCLRMSPALVLMLGTVAVASAQVRGGAAPVPPLSKGKDGRVAEGGQTERSDFRQAGGQGGGKQGSTMFKEGGPQERVQGDKGKPGGPQFLRLTPGNTAGSQMNRLDRRATPNAGVSGRPQAQVQKLPSVEGLKDVPR